MRQKADVVEALRLAARALQRTSVSAQSSSSEEALFKFILESASDRKQFEEQDSASLSPILEEQGDKLRRFAVDRKTYAIGPDSNGLVTPENTAARSKFERLMKVLTQTRIDAQEVLAPLLSAPGIKNSSDVDPENDVVVLCYETIGPIKHVLDEAKLQGLVEDARTEPGAIDRAASRLKDSGVDWEPIVNGIVNPTVQLNNVAARWSVVVDVQHIAKALTDLLSAVQVDHSKSGSPWWVSAKADVGVPSAVLPLIRSGEDYALVARDEADAIEAWAASLPGWQDEPLIIRDVTTEEILGQNLEDAMSNEIAAKMAVVESLLKKGRAVKAMDDEYDSGETSPCPACDGEGSAMGSLGKRKHFRCRDCGMDFSQTEDDDAELHKRIQDGDVEGVDDMLDDAMSASAVSAAKKPQHAVEKDNKGKWRIRSMKDGKLWPQTYDSKQMANKGLAAYHLRKKGVPPKKTKASTVTADVAFTDRPTPLSSVEAQELRDTIRLMQVGLGDDDVKDVPAGPFKMGQVVMHGGSKWRIFDADDKNAKLVSLDFKTKVEVPNKWVKPMKQPVKALFTAYDPKGKLHLRKLKRVVDRGHIEVHELSGAVMEALRLAKVSPRMAGAIADKLVEALFDQEEIEAVQASARKAVSAADGRPMTPDEKEAEAALRKARRDVFDEDPEVASAAEAEIDRAKRILKPYWDERAGEAQRKAGDRKMRLWE